MLNTYLLLLLSLLSWNYVGVAQNTRLRDRLELPAYSTNKSEQILLKHSFVVSYNRKHNIPNWVAWTLHQGRLQKHAKRLDRFLPDLDISSGSPLHEDYTHTGYDRGHMCPAGDNTFHRDAMSASFHMSNVCPQLHGLNAGSWKVLEERCRKWTKNTPQLYIVCGPILSRNDTKRIGKSKKITVPSSFFKAILRKDKNTYRCIGYIFKQNGERRLVTIDEIEEKTGLNLFHNLPDKVERSIESQITPQHWQHWDR